MKIIFAGTPDFAIPALQKLLDSHHEICAIYTKPDKPAGRGQKLTQSPVKIFALANDLPVYQPPSLKDPSAQKQMQELNADILVNVAYGMLLPEAILNIPKFNCINIHPSMLPRWRGAAPIQRSVLAGDTTTGVTIMAMDIGLDTGDIFKQEILPIDIKDTSATLFEKTAEIGANLLLEVLDEIEQGIAKPIPQDDAKTTYANKLTKEEAKIDWDKSAKEIDQMIRAFNPWPIAFMEVDGKHIRVWEADVRIDPRVKPEDDNTMHEDDSEILSSSGSSSLSSSGSTRGSKELVPGTIISADKTGIEIATGDGVILLLKLQLPGGKVLAVSDILNAHKQEFAVGKKL